MAVVKEKNLDRGQVLGFITDFFSKNYPAELAAVREKNSQEMEQVTSN